jgi:hypothetical protein
MSQYQSSHVIFFDRKYCLSECTLASYASKLDSSLEAWASSASSKSGVSEFMTPSEDFHDYFWTC